METVPFGITTVTLSLNPISSNTCPLPPSIPAKKLSSGFSISGVARSSSFGFDRPLSFSSPSPSPSPIPIPIPIPIPRCQGVCQASQVMDLFSTVSPEVVVREARLEDCWDVAETHCSCFFPDYSFPLDIVLRIDRLVGLLSGFSLPTGCKRTCLVAVIGSSSHDTFSFGSEDLKIGGFYGNFSLDRGYVTGILTVDTVADFLPRKGPLRQRRRGIAYISNVAVQDRFRRKGIAKRLIANAEAQARSWGCRAIALHCDVSNEGATGLYKSQGFKCVNVPHGANWPQPRISPDMQFHFMMKRLGAPTLVNRGEEKMGTKCKH